jgi:hypothetical protein
MFNTIPGAASLAIMMDNMANFILVAAGNFAPRISRRSNHPAKIFSCLACLMVVEFG